MRTIIFTLILMLLSSCSGKEKNKALEDAAILCMVLDNTPCKKTEVKPGPVEVKPVPERTELSFILSNPKAVESEIVSFSDPFGGLLTSCERNSKILLAVYGKEISGCDFSNLARESKDWLGQAIEELSKRIFEKEIPEFLDKALKEAIKSGEEAVIAFLKKNSESIVKGVLDNLANSLLPQLSSVLANPILGASLFFIGAQNPNAEVLAKLEKMDAKLDTIILEIAKLYKLSVLTLDSVFEVELKKLYEELMAVKTVINDQKKAGNTAEAKEVSKTALLNALHEKVYGAYKRLAMEMIAKKKAGNTFVSIRPTVYDWYRHEFKCRGEFFGIRWDCYYDDAFAYFDFIEPAGRLSISATDLLILIKLQKLSLELHKVAYGNRSAATIAIAQRYADDIVNLHTIVKTDFEAVNEQLKSYEQRTYVNLWDSNLGPVTKEKALQIIREFIRKNYEPIFLAESALIAQKVQLRAVIETNKSP